MGLPPFLFSFGREPADRDIDSSAPERSDQIAECLGTGNINIGDAAHGEEQCVGAVQRKLNVFNALGSRKDHRACNISDHRVLITVEKLRILNSESGHINPAVVDFDKGESGNQENEADQNTDGDRGGQVKEDRRQHGRSKFNHRTFEMVGKNVADRFPFVHAECRHHQDTGQRRHRDPGHNRGQQEHGDQKADCMENPGQPRLGAGSDRDTRACNRGGSRNAAEKRKQNIADALRNQFLIAVQADTGHVRRTCTAEKAFNHSEGCDTDGGCQKRRNPAE